MKSISLAGDGGVIYTWNFKIPSITSVTGFSSCKNATLPPNINSSAARPFSHRFALSTTVSISLLFCGLSILLQWVNIKVLDIQLNILLTGIKVSLGSLVLGYALVL